MVDGVLKMKGLKSMLVELGLASCDDVIELQVDSAAEKSFTSRRGLGKMRHVELRDLWIHVRQLGCVFQDTAAGKLLVFTQEHSLGTNATSMIHTSYEASWKRPRKQRFFTRKNSSQTSSSAQSLHFEI